MERSDWSEDEPFSFRPPLPPEDRIWRHPSELGALGPRGASAAYVPAAPSHSRGKLVLAVAASATGALLVAGLVTALFRTAGRTSDAAVVEQSVTSFGFSTSLPFSTGATRPPDGVVRLRAVIGGHTHEGSGVVLDGRGTIVTTATAVQGATSIVALLADGTQATAVLLGVDDGAGAAVLSVPAQPLAARTGRALTLGKGDVVHVTDPSFHKGTVAELGARATATGGRVLTHLVRLDLHDGDVTEGAALLNPDEDIVGLVTHDTDGDLYAVPIEIPRAAAQSIAVHGRIVVPWLGVTGMDQATTDGGAVVETVTPGSPAAAAGLAPGDVIVSLEGEQVPSMATLALTLRDYDAGAVIDLTYVRSGTVNVTSVMLAEKPAG